MFQHDNFSNTPSLDVVFARHLKTILARRRHAAREHGSRSDSSPREVEVIRMEDTDIYR